MTSKHLTVAIVDDQPLMRETSRTMVGMFGYDIHSEATNGEDFLDQLAKGQSLPDICLLDISMPVKDGFETAMELRAHYPEIRILAYSLGASPDQIQKIKQCGAHGFLPKEGNPGRWAEAFDQVRAV
ncbi:response regulator [Chitinophaga parva]|uniref:Response regulator n=1 Tax=Chitinophaga parva TaxID=2169414 RepID=A0A2T7BLY6_9BACT|nr:response regulator transcription factor [Chitinophaga parva]PUZ28631.1 response regulator [Chitinophaga parva]